MLQGLKSHLPRGGEDGQALVLFAAGLIGFLGLVAMSIDVGRLVWARTAIQGAVDAAALAGAQSMTNGNGPAQVSADEYFGYNDDYLQSQGQNVSFTTTFPSGNKAVQYTASADIPTWFARVLGFNSWHVSASATAEQQSLDLAVVQDISGSMCFQSNPAEEQTNAVVVFGPGRSSYTFGANTYARPTVLTALTTATTSVRVNDVRAFTTTTASEQTSMWGFSSSGNPYRSISPGGTARTGMIRIDNELMQITNAVKDTNPAVTGTLTVTRARPWNTNGSWIPVGAATTAATHAVGAILETLHAGGNSYCNVAAANTATTSLNGPHEPFDTAIQDAKDFMAKFNTAYDLIGLVKFSSTATQTNTANPLVNTWTTTLNADLNAILFPTGGTNIAQGLAYGRLTVTGPGSRINASKVVVLITDGVPTAYCSSAGYTSLTSGCAQSGSTAMSNCSAPTAAYNDAIAQAATVKAAGGQLFVIGLGPYVLTCALQNIAAAGGGIYYPSPTGADLDGAFNLIAQQVRVKLKS